MTSVEQHNDQELVKIKTAMNVMDGMAPELRKLVHEFNLGLVLKCLNHGMTDLEQIRKTLTEVRRVAQVAINNGVQP